MASDSETLAQSPPAETPVHTEAEEAPIMETCPIKESTTCVAAEVEEEPLRLQWRDCYRYPQSQRCDFPSDEPYVWPSRWSPSYKPRGRRRDKMLFHLGFSSTGIQPQPTGVGAGLWNLGNSCFLNAILQCITHTVPLVQGLRLLRHHKKLCQRARDGFCVVCVLSGHIEDSLSFSGRAIEPVGLLDNLSNISSCFKRYQQEDAHEFLQCLLDKLDTCCLDSETNEEMPSQNNKLVERVFGGRLISKLRCCNCNHFSNSYEPLIDLSLEIGDIDSLPSALESFTKVERIEDTETKFTCENCKVEVSVEKQLVLDQAPLIAAFHLKRFKTDGSYVVKIDKHVKYPLELDLGPYTSGNHNNDDGLKYELYAVVVHVGFRLSSGHYFCFVRSSPNIWHRLDDSKVYSVQEDFVLSQDAYILFYARQGTPWFSSLMESQKTLLAPNILNKSPKSVLDHAGNTLCPRTVNSDRCEDYGMLGSAACGASSSSYGGTSENYEYSGIDSDIISNWGVRDNHHLITLPSTTKSYEWGQYGFPHDFLRWDERRTCRRQLSKDMDDLKKGEQRKETLRYPSKYNGSCSKRAIVVAAAMRRDQGVNRKKNKKKKRMRGSMFKGINRATRNKLMRRSVR